MTRRVGFVGVGAGADAAWALAREISGAAAERLEPAVLAAAPAAHDVLWVHATEEPPAFTPHLGAWLARGGRLLLTQRAAAGVVALGIETEGPNDVGTGRWRHEGDEFWFPEFRAFGEFPHIRGLAAFGPHPLFAGLANGAFVWAPSEGEPDPRAAYVRGRRPARGLVVACERSYIHLNADRIVAWEYPVEDGGVLCLGAFIAPDAPDPLLRRQLSAVLANALTGDAVPHATRGGIAVHWPAPGRAAREAPRLELPPLPALDGALPDLGSPLAHASRALTDAPTGLAGRRVFVAGGEQSGIREVWVHPRRVAAAWGVEVGGETPLVRDAQIAPTVVQRHLVSRARIVEETVTAALEQPVVVVEYRDAQVGRARNLRAAAGIAVTWRTDLRRMWPYDAGAEGDLAWRVDPSRRGLLVTARSGARALCVASQPVEWHVSGAGANVACRVEATLEEPLRLALLGAESAEALGQAASVLERRGVTGLAAQRVRHDAQVREQLVRLRSPDAALNDAFEWAKVRLDACAVDTPGVGRSLVAGYAASRPGWGDGRPGYAWYFGRDACWSAFAALAAGDFAQARTVLRFLGATQDVSGKVIHEYTTSGLAHFDAADATPLYLLLAGRYAAWTGDRQVLEDEWPRLERAYRYCLETDTDGDGLIENSRVGHGWLEMGPLSGAHVTGYLAAVWVAALEALAPVARDLGRAPLAAELVERAGRARAAIARRLVTPEGYALGILRDGSPQTKRTALTAVPLLLGVADPERADAWYDAIAGPEFSTPWGVRLIARSDPLYSPTGYHTGAVWPLFTGWTSLAEYAGHRAQAAFAHLAANARLPFARQWGGFDEVLNGDFEEAAGVCPDQAWSAAMLVAPVVEGLLGLAPDALAERVTLAPHLPAEWAECAWRNLRVGRTVFDARVTRRGDVMVWTLARVSGPPLGVTLAPAAPGEGRMEADVEGQVLPARRWTRSGCAHAEVRFDLVGEHTVALRPAGA